MQPVIFFLSGFFFSTFMSHFFEKSFFSNWWLIKMKKKNLKCEQKFKQNATFTQKHKKKVN